MALTDNYIEKVKVGTTDHILVSKYISAATVNSPDSGYKTWKDITDLVTASTDLVFLTTLPAADAESYALYKNDIVLVPASASATSNACDEYIINRTGTSTYTYSWEKIGTTQADLNNKADHGTYTTTTPSTNVTSSAGAQTASGTATVTYEKSDTATGSAGGFTINGSNFGFSGTAKNLTSTGSYQPACTISKPNVTLNLGSTITYATGAAKSDGTVNAVTGYPNFSGGSASGTFVTSAIKNVKLNSATTTSEGAVAYVSEISGSAPSLGGTKTFNTDAIKSVTLSNDATSTTGPTYVQSISGSAPSLGGTTSFNTDAIKTASLTGTTTFGTAFTVSNGILSLSTGTVGITTTAATKATVTISGGSYTATTKYMKATGNAAGTGTVSISGGSYSATTKYLTGSGDAASTGSVSWTAAALGTANTATVIKSTGLATSTFNNYTSAALASTPTFTGTTATITVEGSYTPAGSITGSQTVTGHTHSIGLTDTEITGTAAVAVSSHTHSLGNHTHSVTI